MNKSDKKIFKGMSILMVMMFIIFSSILLLVNAQNDKPMFEYGEHLVESSKQCCAIVIGDDRIFYYQFVELDWEDDRVIILDMFPGEPWNDAINYFQEHCKETH